MADAENSNISSSLKDSHEPVQEYGPAMNQREQEAQELKDEEEFVDVGVKKRESNKPRKIRKCLDIETKLNIIRLVKEGKSHISIAKEFDVTRTTISKMMKNASRIESGSSDLPTSRGRKSLRLGDNSDLEQELYKWYVETTEHGIRVSGCMLKNKAGELSSGYPNIDFKASNGWLDGFKGRFQISSRRSMSAMSPTAGPSLFARGDMPPPPITVDDSLPVHGPHMCDVGVTVASASIMEGAERSVIALSNNFTES